MELRADSPGGVAWSQLGAFAETILKEQKESDWWCDIDADNEYTPDFLSRALKLAEENDIDTVMGSGDFLSAESRGIKCK
jgi:hypothetical protein